MLYNQHTQIISPDKIKIFKDFLYTKDQYVDDRGDVYDKLMTPTLPGWPIDELKQVLDQVLPLPYEIENADFVRMSFHSRLHTDTADGNQARLYKNIIIPLEENGDAGTAIFPNKWYGPASKFSRIGIPQFQYVIKNTNGQDVLVEDIRELFESLQQTTGVVQYQGNFFNNDRQWLQDLIKKRQTVDPRVQDYTGISNLNDNEFPEDFRKQYLTHLPSENLRGLGLPTIVKWKVGDVITFDRQYLHSGTSTLKTSKSFLAVFTYHA